MTGKNEPWQVNI